MGKCNQLVTSEVKETFVSNNGLPAKGIFFQESHAERREERRARGELTSGRDFTQLQGGLDAQTVMGQCEQDHTLTRTALVLYLNFDLSSRPQRQT